MNFFIGSFKPGTSTEVIFKESEATFNNPYTGLVAWANNPYAVNQLHTLAYAPIYWSEIEKFKGDYDFEAFEEKNFFSYWKSTGVKIIIRFIMDYPVAGKKHMDIPQWLYEELNDGVYYDIPYGQGYSPNYGNEKLIEYHRKVIEAMAERYDDNDMIAYVQLGSLGHYGEWHNYKEANLLPFPNQSVTDKYANHYISYFKNKKLVMRRPYDITAKHDNIGLYNDIIGDENATQNFISWFNNGTTSSETGETSPPMKDFWKSAPSGGEISSEVNMENLFGIQYPKLKKMIEDGHTSFLGPSSPVYLQSEGQATLNVNDLIKTMGYRFRANKAKYTDSVKKNGTVKIELDFENLNNIPFYYDWKMTYYLFDDQIREVIRVPSDFDIRTLVAAKTTDKISFKADVPRGTYSLTCGLVNPATQNPEVRFANLLMDGKCFLLIGYVKVY